MKLLAIETSGSACSVALRVEDALYASHVEAPMQQTQLILPAIQKLILQANIKFNQLDAIAFGCGPGSFTGVRIATSVAQGLGFACDIPLIPISSLAALAQAAYLELNVKKIVVAVDARIHEVYYASYSVNQAGWVEPVDIEKICRPEDVRMPNDPDWYGIGNAWEIYAEQIPAHSGKTHTSCLQTAQGVLALAEVKFANKEFSRPEDVVPAYLRDQVAKKSIE